MVERLGVEEQGTTNQSAWSQNATAGRSVQRERTWEGMVEVVEIVSVSGVHLDLAGMVNRLFPFYLYLICFYHLSKRHFLYSLSSWCSHRSEATAFSTSTCEFPVR